MEDQPVIRPPDEARGLPISLTTGCSFNACTFCTLYRDQLYSVVPLVKVQEQLHHFRQARGLKRIFLGAGDAFSLETGHLLAALGHVRDRLPWVESVGIYAIGRYGLGKSAGALCQLREAGLSRIYFGLETGCDKQLVRFRKPSSTQDCLEFSRRLRENGLWHEVSVLVGLGQVEETAEVLNKMQPDQVRIIPLNGASTQSSEETLGLIRKSGLPLRNFVFRLT